MRAQKDDDIQMSKTALVTGYAGFIGLHFSRRLLEQGYKVVGIDCFSDYYDVELKRFRHQLLNGMTGFQAVEGRIEQRGLLADVFQSIKPDFVFHVAAQPGVRHSIDAPRDYVDANIIGTFEVLEACRHNKPAHLMMASTSSIYGANKIDEFSETDKTDHQVSFYAATKKANEAMAHSYAHLFQIPTTALRFFTVYGPWGRPDMALFKFTKAIANDEAIDLYNYGEMFRDFTYIDDLIAKIDRLKDLPPIQTDRELIAPADSLSPVAPFRTLNIANGKPVPLRDYVRAIETALGKDAKINLKPIPPGDVVGTAADVTLLESLIGETQQTDYLDGVARFVDWYQSYYEA